MKTTSAAPAATTSSWAQRAAAAGNASSSSAAADGHAPTAAADANGTLQKFDARPYVVLDTNALLVSGNGGTGLSRYAKSGKEGEVPAVLVTTAAALAEVRDAASRAALERTRGTGVCELSLREPQDEDVKAVLAFARETGELHSISSTDARLIALARGLERAAGRAHLLRLSPPAPRALRRGGPRARPPPGWGATGGDWAPLDALEEEEERLARASGVGEKKEEGGEEEKEEKEGEEKAAAPPTPEQQQSKGAGGGEEESGESGESDESESDDDDDDDDDGWTTAAKSSAAQRRSKRSAAHRARNGAAAAAAAAAAEGEEEEEGWETASDDDGDSDGDSDSVPAAPSTAAAGEHGELEAAADPAADSPVSLATSDFAMQNVALQMGLKVVTSDPNSKQQQQLRIREARRWALRCSACSFCTREAGRLFCPRCGNAALDKVEVVVDASGVAAFGVRKSHCLKGTKFSLPKPRGGRGGSGPILREDQLLEAMARAKRSNRGRKSARAAAAAAAGDDPLLAPELATADAWFKAAGGENGGLSATAALGGATAALVAAAWKHNPNEARRWGGGVRASGSAGKRK